MIGDWWTSVSLIGSGTLSGKMLFVWIIENNKIDAYFMAGLGKGLG